MVEFALILPVLLLVITGVLSFGFTLNQYMELTNATAVGAQLVGVSRGNTANPCALATSAIQSAAPYLTPASLKLSFTFTPPTGSSSMTPTSYLTTNSCSGGAPLMLQGASFQVVATYPCNLAVYGANLIPTCNLHAQITEMIQ
ncbi:MAG: TadE/TadG family type IV pilus assembly protein [Silvibacterium sp.]